MKVSIIIPVYNVEKYIEECIESVINQSYTDIEVILVDDGSPDNCPSICDSFKQKDNRIVVIHKNNGGLSSARNAGLRAAHGEFVYFLDSDDKLYPGSIALLVKAVEKHPSIDLVYGTTYIQGGTNNFGYYKLDPSRTSQHSCNPIDAKKDILFHYPVIACNKLVRLSLIMESKLFFVEGLLHEDAMWTWQLRNKIVSCSYITEYTYWYRKDNSDSIMSQKDKTKSILSRISIAKEIIKTADLQDINDVIYVLRFIKNALGAHKLFNNDNKSLVQGELKELLNIASSNSMPNYVIWYIKWLTLPSFLATNKVAKKILIELVLHKEKHYLKQHFSL